jgi:hypothetical protein
MKISLTSFICQMLQFDIRLVFNLAWYDFLYNLKRELEASASSGCAGAMGETTGHATGHATGSGAHRLLL